MAHALQVSVGRIVHYFDPAEASAEHPRAAIVTHLWSPTMVNLAVFDPSGALEPRTSVPYGIDEDGTEKAGHRWLWPPRT